MKKALKITKIAVDVAMLAVFLYLMAYRSFMMVGLHSIWGIVLFSLFLIHHVLNYRYYKGIFKGRYNIRRWIMLISDVLLLIFMILMAISAFLMSGGVVDLGIPMTQTSRDVHMIATSWGFILMGLHLGIHLDIPLYRLERKLKGGIFEYVFYVLLFALAAYGVYSFVDTRLCADLFLIIVEEKPLHWAVYMAELFSIVLLFALAMHLALRVISWINLRKIKKKPDQA